MTAAVLLVLASGFTTWRENCTGGCSFELLVLGWPVFLRTPVVPDSPVRPEFFLIQLVVNLIWTAAVSVGGWAVIDTFGRWQDRRRPPPVA
ncbi:MAG: hypothetical protein HY567_01640 [Candidatus Kerfeldbacteria bacterium]|nr:hypothetical protein [Candidatus Kerfeldbacteria bacterium]